MTDRPDLVRAEHDARRERDDTRRRYLNEPTPERANAHWRAWNAWVRAWLVLHPPQEGEAA